MCAQIVDGSAVALKLKREASDLTRQLGADGHNVRLDAIIVGDPSSAALYARSQEAQCEQVGIEYRLHNLPEDASQDQIRGQIEALNSDPQVTGIMLNLPLPDCVDTPAMQYAIDPYKDVEGINPSNIGMLFYDSPIIAPCTALAVMEILSHVGCKPRGLDAVVVGQSAIAGRPIALFLQHELATVTTCHIETRDLQFHTRAADLLIVAAGKPHLIGRDHVKAGAVVIDVGINRVADPSASGGYRTVGDVDLDAVASVASVITPVPGGVGPVTVAMLLRSAVDAARSQLGHRRITG